MCLVLTVNSCPSNCLAGFFVCSFSIGNETITNEPGIIFFFVIAITNPAVPDLEEISERLKQDETDYSVGKSLEAPPFAEDSPIWVVKSDKDSPKRSFLERATADDEDTAMGRRKERSKHKKNK